MVNLIDSDIQKDTKEHTAMAEHLKKIFVGGLPPEANENLLQDYFSQFGLVTDAVVMRDISSKRPRGFGFVTFASETAVSKVQDARPHKLQGKLIDTKRAQPRNESVRGNDMDSSNNNEKKIFIGGLKECHTEDALFQYFSQFGNVATIKVIFDRNTGRGRGFGFLEFIDANAVDKAISINRHTINYTPVDVKKCINKPDRFQNPIVQNDRSNMQFSHNDYNNSEIGDVGYTPYTPLPQMPVNLSNNWNNYYQTNGQQQQNFAVPPDAVYNGQYGINSSWPANSYATQPYQTIGWPQNNYTTTPTSNTVDCVQQTFGEYKQTYNGGPQKGNFLQNKRVNPYGNHTVVSPKYGI